MLIMEQCANLIRMSVWENYVNFRRICWKGHVNMEIMDMWIYENMSLWKEYVNLERICEFSKNMLILEEFVNWLRICRVKCVH